MKHPDRFVHAHTCNLDHAIFGSALTINTDTLISWQDELTKINKDKKKKTPFKKFYSSKKAEYASKLTKIEHLSIEDISEFFSDCQERINKLIDNSFP